MSEKRCYVVGFYFASGSTVLAIRKRRPAWQRGQLNGIGGHVEADENFDMAMEREFLEETGVYVRVDRWTHFCTLHGPARVDVDDFEGRFYFAETRKGDACARTVTDEQVLWVSVDRLIEEGVPDLRWLLPMVHPSIEGDWPFSVSRAGGRAEADED